jgi:acetyl-CoA carboxylase carboxyltransferase component
MDQSAPASLALRGESRGKFDVLSFGKRSFDTPTGEFGGMGLEGAVKLGYRNEIAAVDDPQKRKAFLGEMVARIYQHGKVVSIASAFEIDDVIDQMESRRWSLAALDSSPRPAPRTGKKRSCVDTW